MDELAKNTNLGVGKSDLLDYLIIFAKYSRVIIIVSAAVTVLAYLNFFCLANTYSARARMLLPQQYMTMSAQILDAMRGGTTPGGAGGASQGLGVGGIAANLLGIRSPGAMYVAMMKSDPVLDRIITRFKLQEVYGSNSLEQTRKGLIGSSHIMDNKTDFVIDIAVNSNTPKLAADIANAFIEELDRLLQGLAHQEAKGRAVFLEKERFQASQNLVKAEEAMRLFSEKNNVLQIDTQTRGTLEYIARLRADIDAKEVGVQVLRQQATPLNYDVVLMETEIKGLKEKLNSAESQLGDRVSNVCLPTGKTPSLSLEYLRLLREVKFQEIVYQLYTKLVEVARLDMVRNVAVVQVLAPAMPPEKRANLRAKPALAYGLVTFILMIVIAFGQEYLQKVKNSEDDVHRFTVLKGYLDPWNNILINIKKIIRFDQSKRKL